MNEKSQKSGHEGNLPMRSLNHFIGYTLQGPEGDLGKVKDFIVDDKSLAVRYLVADTGGWFSSNQVLISTEHLVNPEEHGEATTFLVNLTKEEIKNCLPLSADSPISRRYEEEYARFNEQVPYWASGNNSVPGAGATAEDVANHSQILSEIEACHLRSISEMIGYAVVATDGDAGSIKDFIAEMGTWRVHYLVIESGSWFTNKEYLIDISWVDIPDWNSQSIALVQTKAEIKDSPEFDPNIPVNRDYEVKLYDYYGKAHRWIKLS